MTVGLDNAPENFAAVMRRLAVNLLGREKTTTSEEVKNKQFWQRWITNT